MTLTTVSDKTGDKRCGTRFEPGKSGNPAGRPKGARSKLGEAFIGALLADFEQHGVAAIAKVRDERPADYIKVIASILPKEIAFDEGTSSSLAELILAGRRRVARA